MISLVLHSGMENGERARLARSTCLKSRRRICVNALLPLLLSMVGRVFPFHSASTLVDTRFIAAGVGKPTSARAMTCPSAPHAFLRPSKARLGSAIPDSAWPPAWARPHLRLAEAGQKSRRTPDKKCAQVWRASSSQHAGAGSAGAYGPRSASQSLSGPAGSSFRPRPAWRRKGPGLSSMRPQTRPALRGGVKKSGGPRSAFPSARTSKIAPWMAKRQASGVAADGSKSKTTGSGGGSGGYKLVIVESPAKARTIQKFLDASFVVESCMGHVRDLPQKARDVPPELKGTYGKMLGVDPDNGFAALYVTMKGKEAVIRSLKAKLKFASELILASDEDREGEAISWHLLQLLKPSSKVHVKRAVFHEITREAILRAFEAPRDVDYNLVHAQEARRILDRLAGYTMSPLLWRKISPGLSAGRVQSVGLAMIVRRERERLAFVSAEYFDLKANLTAGGEGSVSSSSRGGDCFSATLVETEGTAVASGRDFDSQGRLKTNETAAGARGGKLVWLDRQEAERLRERLEAPRTRWAVASVESKQQRRRPPVPFITSTLQQEANRKLSLSSKECMRVAQSLYEAGWITYMRTDNPVLSEAAKAKARQCVQQLYGADNLGSETRAIKKPKGSQEAHEPIRPALTDDPNAPGGFNIKPPLQGIQLRLYDMILARTLASVMIDAVLDLTSVQVSARSGGDGDAARTTEPALAVFRASGMVVRNPGWMRAYQEGSDGSLSASPSANADSGYENKLPPLAVGEKLACRDVNSIEHKTRAPPRYTEASFVKELEAEGIGRPSTYAQILETLKDRGYVHVEGKAICPSLKAVVVVQLLERHFKEFVDTAFTARMEAQLDRIAMGEVAKERYLSEYYLGPEGLRDKVQMSADLIEPEEARRALLPFRFEESSSKASQRFGNVSVFVGPYGAYAQAIRSPDDDGAVSSGSQIIKANLPDAVCRDVVLLTSDTVLACLEAKQGPHNGTLLGHDDESGLPILLRVGRFGAYLQVGELIQPTGSDDEPAKPRTVSLPKDVALSQVDMDLARKFLSLPRLVCQHPETGKDVLAGLGPYGPFVRHSTTYRSLTASDDVLSIGADRALELLASASKNSLASQTLAHVGQLDGKNITVMKGRFGPYLKFGAVNARLPDLYQDMPEEIPLADAMEAILAKTAQEQGKTKGAKTASKSKTSGKSAGASKKAKPALKGVVKARPKEAPKRGKSAFLFFCAEKRAEVAAKGLSFGDITKELGAMWKGLKNEEKQPYEEMSTLDKLKCQGAKQPLISSTTARKKIEKSSQTSAKRPRSAYLFFCAEMRPDVASQGLSFGEITKRLSAMWKELEPQERAKYEAMAKGDRERYRSELASAPAK